MRHRISPKPFRAARPPQEVSSTALPFQDSHVAALFTHDYQGRVMLLALLQSSATESREEQNEATRASSRSDLVGRWQVEDAGSLPKLTLLETLNLPGCMKHVASCKSAIPAAVFGKLFLLSVFMSSSLKTASNICF